MVIELPIISIVLTIVGLILNFVIFDAKAKSDRNKFEQEIIARISKTETQVELFWTCIKNNVADILRSPNHPERDQLMEKLQHDTIDKEELYRLSIILKESLTTNNDDKAVLCLALSTVEAKIKVGK